MMDDLGKKVGYLKGLLEGMDCADNSAEAKLYSGIVDLLGDLSDRTVAMEELVDDLNEYVESIDDDLSELEDDQDDDFATIDDDEFEDYPDENETLRLLDGKTHGDSGEEKEQETLAGSICPDCGRLFFIDEDDPEDAEYICPHCAHQVLPQPLTAENAPIAHPVEKK